MTEIVFYWTGALFWSGFVLYVTIFFGHNALELIDYTLWHRKVFGADATARKLLKFAWRKAPVMLLGRNWTSVSYGPHTWDGVRWFKYFQRKGEANG